MFVSWRTHPAGALGPRVGDALDPHAVQPALHDGRLPAPPRRVDQHQRLGAAATGMRGRCTSSGLAVIPGRWASHSSRREPRLEALAVQVQQVHLVPAALQPRDGRRAHRGHEAVGQRVGGDEQHPHRADLTAPPTSARPWRGTRPAGRRCWCPRRRGPARCERQRRPHSMRSARRIVRRPASFMSFTYAQRRAVGRDADDAADVPQVRDNAMRLRVEVEGDARHEHALEPALQDGGRPIHQVG